MNNRDQISHLIGVLTRDFVNSRSPHAKKGGLIGLASVAIGLRDVRIVVVAVVRAASKKRNSLSRPPKIDTLSDVPLFR